MKLNLQKQVVLLALGIVFLFAGFNLYEQLFYTWTPQKGNIQTHDKYIYQVQGDTAALMTYEVGSNTDSILSANAQTVTTETDTISASSFSSAYTVDVFAVDDTLQISLDNSNFMRIMPYSGLRLENISPSWSTNLYIKQYGTAGTASYDYIIAGR